MDLKTGLCLVGGTVLVAGSVIIGGVTIKEKRQKEFESTGMHRSTKKDFIKNANDEMKLFEEMKKDAIELKQAELKSLESLQKSMNKYSDLSDYAATLFNIDKDNVTTRNRFDALNAIMQKKEEERTPVETKIAKKLQKPFDRYENVKGSVEDMTYRLHYKSISLQNNTAVLENVKEALPEKDSSGKKLDKITDKSIANMQHALSIQYLLTCSDGKEFGEAFSSYKKDPKKFAAKVQQLQIEAKKKALAEQQAKEAENAKTESQPESPQPVNK